jgi:PPOX class probable F420-dependent enzyme
MAALTPEEQQFLRDNILCVISTTKRDGSPQSTPVYYVFENGKLYISVTRPRAKTRNVLRDPRVSVVVLHTEPPFPHVQITGTAEITEDDLEPLTRRIFSLFMQSLPENFTQVLKQQERQLMVVTPRQVNSTLSVRR